MLTIRPLNDRFAVAPQIAPEDLPAVKAAGYVAVVNNRPDQEGCGPTQRRCDPRRGGGGRASPMPPSR
jgi:uncharacterized protein (TIGR01244 family)